MAKKKKRKPVNFELIDNKTNPLPYAMMFGIIKGYHEQLQHARIALAWRYGWQHDKDGRLTLGQMRKASDLDRELRDYDAVILLNREVWEDGEFTDAQRAALLDHELCHLRVQTDRNGHPVRDERGRLVYRIRKHDLGPTTAPPWSEEYQAVLAARAERGLTLFNPLDARQQT